MKYDANHKSADVEDRRGAAPRRGAVAGVSVVTLVIGVVAYFVLGKDAALGILEADRGRDTPAVDGSSSPEDDEQVAFISFALDDMQDTWTKLFQEQGKRYSRAKLVLFRDGVDSACKYQTSAVGPFYCPGDRKAYIDLSFYTELKQRFGASGDFAEAYVLAHEIGHHVQNLLEANAEVARLERERPGDKNALSIRLELQADCYAGVWAHFTKKRELLDKGDIEEGLKAAAAIGDDAIQKKAGARVRPESWTHGSSQQRATWFKRGVEKGTIDACDTLHASAL